MTDSPSPPQQSRPHGFIVWLSVGCGLGHLPKGPGTWGSLGGLPVVWALQQSGYPEIACAVGAVVLFVVGIPICQAGADHFQVKDPKQVVFDEIAAFPVVFLLVPMNWWTAILGFALFRLFDIAKPGPIRWLDKWEGGLGIMADDTLASVFAGIVLTGVYWLAGGYTG
ncbi:MAG: phosphatidylglycerophosphatase A [Planctomycetaceae bacterium]|nr:phosphatidylglycerophosphatase A [Planctomycetaceae bacterium]